MYVIFIVHIFAQASNFITIFTVFFLFVCCRILQLGKCWILTNLFPPPPTGLPYNAAPPKNDKNVDIRSSAGSGSSVHQPLSVGKCGSSLFSLPMIQCALSICVSDGASRQFANETYSGARHCDDDLPKVIRIYVRTCVCVCG